MKLDKPSSLINMKVDLKIDGDSILVQARKPIERAVNTSLGIIESDWDRLIQNGLIFGGTGWQKPFIKSLSWEYITSPKGRAELGFVDGTEAIALLDILKKSFKVRLKTENVWYNPTKGIVSGNTANMNALLEFNLFDIIEIKKNTIHPYAGTGKLEPNTSWFTWIYAGKPVSVPATFEKSKLKKSGKGAPRSLRIAGSEAGTMKPGGSWEVIPQNKADLELLVWRNRDKILQVIRAQIQRQLKSNLEPLPF